jgi:hypothetical protein
LFAGIFHSKSSTKQSSPLASASRLAALTFIYSASISLIKLLVSPHRSANCFCEYPQALRNVFRFVPNRQRMSVFGSRLPPMCHLRRRGFDGPEQIRR